MIDFCNVKTNICIGTFAVDFVWGKVVVLNGLSGINLITAINFCKSVRAKHVSPHKTIECHQFELMHNQNIPSIKL